MKKVFMNLFLVLLLASSFVFVSYRNAYAVVLADIVFVFDESSSMGDEQTDVINNLAIFTQAMIDAGISAQYGLVGFGYGGLADPYIRLVRDLTDASDFQTGLGELHEIGLIEKGFQATKFALDNITWRVGDVTKVVVVITDEDSDGAESGAHAALTAYGALWNGIVNFDDYVGPAGDYDFLATNHGGQIFDIHAFNADPTGFFTFFAQHKVQEILGNGNGGPVIPEPSTMLLLGAGLLGFVGLRKKRLS